MTADRTPEYLAGLVRGLCKLPRETEWLEFKVSNGDPLVRLISDTVGDKLRAYLPFWA
jgi:hypothetical protein